MNEVAQRLGQQSIYIDLNQEYADMAIARLSKLPIAALMPFVGCEA